MNKDRGMKKKLKEEKKEIKLEKARQLYINTHVYMHTYCIYIYIYKGRKRERREIFDCSRYFQSRLIRYLGTTEGVDS
jgi:hypothetical protein